MSHFVKSDAIVNTQFKILNKFDYIYFSKHFIERSIERKIDLVELLPRLVGDITNHMCLRIYELTIQDFYAIPILIDGVTIRYTYDQHLRKFIMKTLYRKR